MVKKRYLISILILLILFSSLVYAIDSFICLPTDVIEGNTMTCEADLANGNTEKNKAWNMTWYNTSAQLLAITDCSFTGTTANQKNPPDVVQGCDIPSSWGDSAGNATVNFSLTTIPTSKVFYYNISQDSSVDLTLDGFVVESPCYLGQLCGLQFTVKKSSTAKTVLGADCTVDILELVSGNLVPIEAITIGETRHLISKYDGHVLAEMEAQSIALGEGMEYIIEVRCDCRAGKDYCYDDDGTSLTNETSNSLLRGLGTATLTVDTWLETTTSVDLINIELKQRNTVSVNVTNNRTDIRVPIEVDYDCRINTDDDNSTRRIKSPFYFPECQTYGECDVIRGISADTTQEQSTDFIVEEHPFLQGRDTEAVCATYVKIIDIISDLVSYSSTSSTFYINSSELNLEPDWQWISDKRLNSIVNLTSSSFDDYNGTGTGNIDLRLDISVEQDIRAPIEVFNLISNVSVENQTQYLTEHTHYELEFLDDGNIELEIRDVSLSKYDGTAWWNVTLDFYDNILNQSESLADIATKTGTFHFEVNAPSSATAGEAMSFDVSAQVEDNSGDKEVKFICYINGERAATETSWNSMVSTSTQYSATRTINLPSNLTDGTHTLTCTINYYNFGSRSDTATDTFTSQHASTTNTGGNLRGGGDPYFFEEFLDETLIDEITPTRPFIKKIKEGPITGLEIQSNTIIRDRWVKIRSCEEDELKPINDEVYSYFCIDSNIEDHELSQVKINFKIKKDWAKNKRGIILKRYTDEWDELYTEIFDKSWRYYHYQGISQGLSLFAITGIGKDDLDPITGAATSIQNLPPSKNTFWVWGSLIFIIIVVTILIIRNRNIKRQRRNKGY